MIRYNITEFRSRDGPAIGVETCRPAGTRQRERSLPASLHRASVRWSLVGSLAGHAALLIALLSLAGSVMLPNAQEPASVALVLEAAAPAAPVPEPPSPAPSPAPAAAPAVTQPALPPQEAPTPATPEPTPPPEAPPVPAQLPPLPQAEPVPAQTPPPPPETEPPTQPPPTEALPSPTELPPPAAPGPPPLPARRTPPPRAATVPPRITRSAPAGPAPGEAPRTQTAPPAGSAAAASAPPAPIAPGWQSAVSAWLESHKTYPAEARRRGEEGRATVRFTVQRDGLVVAVQLVSGTGSTILDDAVERMLRGARLPAFPPGMDQAEVTLTVPIGYRMQ